MQSKIRIRCLIWYTPIIIIIIGPSNLRYSTYVQSTVVIRVAKRILIGSTRSLIVTLELTLNVNFSHCIHVIALRNISHNWWGSFSSQQNHRTNIVELKSSCCNRHIARPSQRDRAAFTSRGTSREWALSTTYKVRKNANFEEVLWSDDLTMGVCRWTEFINYFGIVIMYILHTFILIIIMLVGYF